MKRVDRDSRAWDMGTSTNSRSFELESWSYIQHKDYQLHLLQKAEKLPSNRPTIPATEGERLAFYRAYVTAPAKLQITYMQQFDFSRFYWIYLKNVLLRSLPLNYLHVFLAAYSPDEHLFSSKMCPIFIGVSWQVLLCGILQLVYCADILSLILHYALHGFLFQSPWNRCGKFKYYYQPPFPFKIKCLPLHEFLRVTKNYTYVGLRKPNHIYNYPIVQFYANYYWLDPPFETPFVQTAPLFYFLKHWIKASVIENLSFEWIGYFAFLWIFAGLMYKSLFRRHVWKFLRFCQLANNSIYVFCAVLALVSFLEKDLDYEHKTYRKKVMDATVGWDFDMMAESVTGPPVVQLLTARSVDRHIEPGRDSVLIVVSNAVFYLFRALVNNKIKSYIEAQTHLPMTACFFNPFPIFTFWNIFFNEIYFGSILLRLFYLVTFLVECTVFVITYQIVLEVIVCEYKWSKRWIATILLSTVGLALNSTLELERKRYLYIYTTAISSLTEMLIVCWMYPLGRLFDDMTFHFGARPPAVRMWSLWLMPFYCVYKLYVMLWHMVNMIKRRETDVSKRMLLYNMSSSNEMQETIALDFSKAEWMWVVSLVPLFFGIFHAMIKYMIMQKQSWRVLFKPRPDWGPRDHVTRQLRKQFDSRDYVGSQASRYLSRHVLTRAETSSYRLDIRYDIGGGRRSTIFTEGFHFEDDRE